MAARSGELERASRPLLTSDVGEVGWFGLERLVGRLDPLGAQLAPQIRDRFAQVPHRNRLHSGELCEGDSCTAFKQIKCFSPGDTAAAGQS